MYIPSYIHAILRGVNTVYYLIITYSFRTGHEIPGILLNKKDLYIIRRNVSIEAST